MDYAGFYINLDRRADRRAALEGELAQYGLQNAYKRFAAVEGNASKAPNSRLQDGETGCFLSHLALLKENLGSPRHLHIVEDDVVFSSCTAQAIQWAIGQGHLENYDIVYLDVFVPLLNDAYKAYKKFYDSAVKRDATGRIVSTAFSVIDLKGLIFGSTASFLVSKNAVQKLHDFHAQELARGLSLPIDLFIRKLCNDGVIKVGCIFPFVTSVRFEHVVDNDIARAKPQLSALAADIARYAFFIGADFAKCRDYLNKYMPLPAGDEQTQILSHLLAFSLTDDYKAP